MKRVVGFSNQQGGNDLEAIRYFQPWAVGYIVASPRARDHGVQGIPEKDVWELGQALRTFALLIGPANQPSLLTHSFRISTTATAWGFSSIVRSFA